MKTNRNARKHWGAGVLALIPVGLAVTACVSAVPSDGAQVKTPAPAASASAASPSAASASAAPPTAIAPLTGLPVRPRTGSRPAVALDLSGRHPNGLSSADLVYEEITSPRRYVAVFQSRKSRNVGPVSDTRPADGPILSVLRALLGYDSGTPSFIKVLDNTDVTDLGYAAHSSLYRAGPGGLTTSTAALARAARGAEAPALFSYRGTVSGSNQLATAGQWRASTVRLVFPGRVSQTWTFDTRSNAWVDSGGGPAIRVDNLIVQIVPYKTVFLSRKLGLTTVSARVFGRGQAEVFSGLGDTPDHGPGGLAAKGDWSKPGLQTVTNYVDSKGYPMELQPGSTWVILAPPGTRVETHRVRS